MLFRSLHHSLAGLLLSAEGYYYDKKALVNLLSLACIVNKYWVRMDTRIDNAIYVQSKTDGRSISFQRCHDHNLYYLDLENLEMNETCLFTPLDEKRAREVQKLQEMCGSPSNADFVQSLEHNKIPGVDFTKRDVRIAKDLLGYSEYAAKGKMKQPRKGVQMTDNKIGRAHV